MIKKNRHLCAIGLIYIFCSSAVIADGLYDPSTYKAYTSDHKASRVGDSVTLLIFENSEAMSNTDNAGNRSFGAGLEFNGTARNEFGNLAFDSNEEDSRATQREGQLRAQITAVVKEIDAVGRMRISGDQTIVVNGEQQVITINGWVRGADISPANTVISTRLSDAFIEYKGDTLEGLDSNKGILRRTGDIVMWVPRKALDLTIWLLGVL